MSSDQATVQFKASIDELLKGISDATSALQQGFAGVTETVKTTSAALEQSLGRAAADTAQQIQELGNQTRNSSEQLDNIAGKIDFAFAYKAVSEAVGKIREFIAAVKEVAAAASDVIDTAYAFGITTKELQGLKALSAETGTDFEAVSRVLLILQQRLTEAAQGSKEAAESLATFGISAQQFNDPAFTSTDALVKIAQSSTNAAEKIQLFGRANVSVIGLLGPLEQGLTAVTDAADENGAATRGQLEVLAQFNSFMNLLTVQFQNFVTVLTAEVSPTLIAIYQTMDELISREGPIRELLGAAFTALGFVIKSVAIVIIGALQAVRIVIDALLGSLKLALDAISGFAKALELFLVGDFNGAWSQAKGTVTQIGDNFKLLSGIISDEMEAAGTSMRRFFTTVEEGKEKTSPKNAEVEKRPDRGRVGMRKQEQDSMAEELKLQYDMAAAGSEKRIQLANELVARMLRVYGQDSDQYRTALRTQLEAVRQYNEEQRKLGEARAQSTRDAAMQELELEKAKLDQAIALGTVSLEEQYRQQQDFADRRLEIEREYYERMKALRAEDAVAQEQAQAGIQEAQRERQKAAIEGMTERIGAIRQKWEGVLSPISSAFSGAVQGMIQGTETLSNAVRKMSLNILLSFADLAVKKTVKWIAGELAMTSATAANAATRAALEDAGAKKGIISGAFAALKKIAQFAATAAAGAFQAIVSIPYVGPFLAPAAAVAAGAAVLALGKSIASAAGGWVVPSDQLAMVHKDEMILPARLSSGLQNLIADKSESGGGMNSYQFTVNAMDSGDVSRWFKKNARAVVEAMSEEAMRFNPKMSPQFVRGGS